MKLLLIVLLALISGTSLAALSVQAQPTSPPPTEKGVPVIIKTPPPYNPSPVLNEGGAPINAIKGSPTVEAIRGLSKDKRKAAAARVSRIPLGNINPETLAKAIGDERVSKEIFTEVGSTKLSKPNWGKFFRLLGEAVEALFE
jgi:hypothetical protein